MHFARGSLARSDKTRRHITSVAPGQIVGSGRMYMCSMREISCNYVNSLQCGRGSCNACTTDVIENKAIDQIPPKSFPVFWSRVACHESGSDGRHRSEVVGVETLQVYRWHANNRGESARLSPPSPPALLHGRCKRAGWGKGADSRLLKAPDQGPMPSQS